MHVEPILSVKTFKDRFLFGVDLVDHNGKKMSNKVLSDKLKAATGWLERALDISITPKVHSIDNGTAEIRDYRWCDLTNWFYLKAHDFPILSVENLKIKFPSNTTLVTFPVNWIAAEKHSGIVRLVPDGLTMPDGFFYYGGAYYGPGWALGRETIPQIIYLEYTSGFAEGTVPYEINQAIGYKAALDVLATMGDLVLSPGISDQSISIDGVVQSSKVNGSADMGGHASKKKNYEKELKEHVELLRRFYKGITVTST